jgi:hypothetical protein
VTLSFKPPAPARVEVEGLVDVVVPVEVPAAVEAAAPVVPDGCEEPQPAASSSAVQATGIALAALIGTLTLT